MKLYKSLFIISLLVLACSSSSKVNTEIDENTIYSRSSIAENNNAYWYQNKAEITSYQLNQARYGELHKGNAVLIFVTEPFSKKTNTKADNPTNKDVSVLKLNHLRKFNTGIYPYSIMTSTFFPFQDGIHSIKISSSSQEWCGHTYMELKNENSFSIQTFSYFEGENNGPKKFKKHLLEDDIWSMIRIRTNKLPIGQQMVYPSMIYCRLLHIEFKPYECILSLKNIDNERVYTVFYPELKRELLIKFETEHPHKITYWEESYESGWGDQRKKLTTTATVLNVIHTDYWHQNHVKDSVYRTLLKL